MRKRIIYLGILLLSIGCNSNGVIEENNNFFDFDEVIHYSIDFDEKEIDAITSEYDGRRKKQRVKIQVIVGDLFNKMEDTSFLSELKYIGFTKNRIPEKFNSNIDDIFSESSIEDVAVSACEAIYRDAFVFKRRGMTIGLAKICFECNQAIVAGTDKNTYGFEDGLRPLKKIVKR